MSTMDTVVDARKLPEKAVELLRRRAVAEVLAGTSQAEVARALGVSRKSVGFWIREYRAQGERAFHQRKRGRKPGAQLALSGEQQTAVLETVLHCSPEEAGLPYRLWTRQALAELINREHRVSLSTTTVSSYLLRWGLVRELGTARVPGPRQGRPAPGAQPIVPVGGPVTVTWTRPLLDPAPGVRLPPGAAEQYRAIHLLTAVSARGSLALLANPDPFDGLHVRDFAERVRRHVARRVTLLVCEWPLAHIDTLLAWAADDGHVLLQD